MKPEDITQEDMVGFLTNAEPEDDMPSQEESDEIVYGKVPQKIKNPEFRKRVAHYICECMEDSETKLSRWRERIDAVETQIRGSSNLSDYSSQVQTRAFEPDGEDTFGVAMHIPMASVLLRNTSRDITQFLRQGGSTIVTADIKDPELNKYSQDVSNLIQFFWDNDDFSRKLRLHAENVAFFNITVARVTPVVSVKGFQPGDSVGAFATLSGKYDFAGFKTELIPVRQFLPYPHGAGNSDELEMMAHFWRSMPKSQVESKIESGEYFKKVYGYEGKILSKASPVDNLIPNSSLITAFQGESAERCNIWSGMVVYDCGDGDKWYEFLVDRTNRELLKFREYIYNRSHYVIGYLSEEPGRVIPMSSLGSDLQLLQLVINENISNALDGAKASIVPMVFASGNAFKGETKVQPGTGVIYELKDGMVSQDLQIVQVPFDINNSMAMANFCLAQSEKVASVSSNDIGQRIAGGATATEVATIAESNAAMASALMDSFGHFVCQCAVRGLEILVNDYEYFLEVYGESLPLSSLDPELRTKILNSSITFEITGKTASRTPAGRISAIMQLLAIVAQIPELKDMLKKEELLKQVAATIGNVDTLVKSPEEMQEELMAPQQQLKEQINAQEQTQPASDALATDVGFEASGGVLPEANFGLEGQA